MNKAEQAKINLLAYEVDDLWRDAVALEEASRGLAAKLWDYGLKLEKLRWGIDEDEKTDAPDEA